LYTILSITPEHTRHGAQCAASPPAACSRQPVQLARGRPRGAASPPAVRSQQLPWRGSWRGSLCGQPARRGDSRPRSVARRDRPWPCAPWRGAFAPACSPAGAASGPRPARHARVPAYHTVSRRARPAEASPSPSSLSSRLPHQRRALVVRSSPSPLAKHLSPLCDIPR
jgi:hypothetical protein